MTRAEVKNNEQLINIIYDNRFIFFKNTPANFSKNDIIGVKVKSSNNKEGFIVIDLSIKNYYQEKIVIPKWIL